MSCSKKKKANKHQHADGGKIAVFMDSANDGDLEMI